MLIWEMHGNARYQHVLMPGLLHSIRPGSAPSWGPRNASQQWCPSVGDFQWQEDQVHHCLHWGLSLIWFHVWICGINLWPSWKSCVIFAKKSMHRSFKVWKTSRLFWDRLEGAQTFLETCCETCSTLPMSSGTLEPNMASEGARRQNFERWKVHLAEYSVPQGPASPFDKVLSWSQNSQLLGFTWFNTSFKPSWCGCWLSIFRSPGTIMNYPILWPQICKKWVLDLDLLVDQWKLLRSSRSKIGIY